jgi:hypothetical protein
VPQGEEGVHGFFDTGEDGVDHFERILFMPARELVDLVEFDLVLGHGNTGTIEDDKTRTRRTLIDSTDETVFKIIGTTVFILQQRAIAVVGLVGVDIDLGLELLLFKSIVDFRHVEGVSHCEGVCIENRVLQKESKMRRERKRMRGGER